MAHSQLFMINPTTGVRRQAPVGFSWTSLFFGPFPCIWRQDWQSAIVVFLLSVVLMFFGLNIVLWILQGFFYNKYYVQKLVESGYQVERWEGRPIEQIEQNAGVKLTMVSVA